MKQLIYILAMTLFLGLLTGCGGDSSSGENEETVPAIQLPTDPEAGEITVPTMKLSAKPGIDEILLRWNAVNHVTGYELEWGEIRDTLENSIPLDVNQIQYLHQDLQPETTYYYRITAKYIEGQNGKASEIVAVKTGSIVEIMQSDVAY